ncbi:hypothetical protein GCK72_024092 [Caenorhabditis remanei]|uniref:Uncharacterized protein n=1 Tax=Caenorhabditis remanei TaxID=31234 RepID=A0A6A5FYI8_CAERE|nr:hypothetical protein GCK72_024092 [Caenorhabditis remanei]KAF1747627.1 hypothetical protein GCK72_024092 [Caenorhabditis remanei]
MQVKRSFLEVVFSDSNPRRHSVTGSREKQTRTNLVFEKVGAVEFLNVFSLVVVSGHEFVVVLSVIVSAESAELALGRNRWNVGLDGVSVETDFSLWKTDDNQFFLTTDNLDDEFIRVLVHLLGENSESWLLRAVLRNKGEAGGEWGTVDDVVKGGNLGSINLAGSSGLFPDLLVHGTASDGWKEDTWDTDILEFDLLLWSLDGHVDVLAGKWLNGELKNSTTFLILDTLLGNSPEIVSLDEVEETGEGVFSFLGELVLGDNIDLVETSSLDQKFVFWDSVELAFHVADSKLNLTVWLLTELTEGRWHLWADSKKFGVKSPFLGLLGNWGTTAVHLNLAHADVLVADSAEFVVPVHLLWGLEFHGDEVLVSLFRLDLTDHLVEILTTVLRFIVLHIKFLFEDLVEFDLRKISLLKVSDSETGNKLSWAVLVLKSVFEVLLSHKNLWKGPLREDISLGVDLESENFVFTVNLFGSQLVLWVRNSLLLGFSVLSFLIFLHTNESDWASVNGNSGLLVFWDNELVGDLEGVLLELSIQLKSQWSVNTGGLKRFGSNFENWGPEAHLSDVGRGDRWNNVEVIVQKGKNRLDIEFSVSDVLLEKVVNGLHVKWKNNKVHILVAEIEDSVSRLFIGTLDTWADVHLLDDLLEHLDSGLNTTGTEFIGLFSVEGKLEDWELGVGGENLFLWLVTGEEKNLGATDSQWLSAWVGGSSELTDDVVGERSNVLVGFLLHLRNDVSKNWFLWESFHQSPEGSHTELWLVLTVLVDWKENFLDLAWHNILEKTEGFDGFCADSKWLTWVLDELDELVDGHVDSSVSKSLESKNLLVSGFSTAEVLHEDADVLLLELTGSWTSQWKILSLGSESADNGSGGKPSRLTKWLVSLSKWRLGEFDEKIGDVLTGEEGFLD